MDILSRTKRAINLNNKLIEELLAEYTRSLLHDDVIMAVNKLQEANAELTILRAAIVEEKGGLDDDDQ